MAWSKRTSILLLSSSVLARLSYQERERESCCSDFRGQCHCSLRNRSSNVPRFLYWLIAAKSTVHQSPTCPRLSSGEFLPLRHKHLAAFSKSPLAALAIMMESDGYLPIPLFLRPLLRLGKIAWRFQVRHKSPIWRMDECFMATEKGYTCIHATRSAHAVNRFNKRRVSSLTMFIFRQKWTAWTSTTNSSSSRATKNSTEHH